MTVKTDYRVAFALPASFWAAMVVVYLTLVNSGFDRERALDILTIALVLGMVALLRGTHRVQEPTGSLEFGVLVVVLLGTAALALRSLSLVRSAGPLFFVTFVSQGGFAYVAIRIMRRIKRRAVSSDSEQAAPPT
jgi:hypothetical protein